MTFNSPCGLDFSMTGTAERDEVCKIVCPFTVTIKSSVGTNMMDLQRHTSGLAPLAAIAITLFGSFRLRALCWSSCIYIKWQACSVMICASVFGSQHSAIALPRTKRSTFFWPVAGTLKLYMAMSAFIRCRASTSFCGANNTAGTRTIFSRIFDTRNTRKLLVALMADKENGIPLYCIKTCFRAKTTYIRSVMLKKCFTVFTDGDTFAVISSAYCRAIMIDIFVYISYLKCSIAMAALFGNRHILSS